MCRPESSNVPRFIMENGAKGVEVIISGKLRAQRAKARSWVLGRCLLPLFFSSFVHVLTTCWVRDGKLTRGL